ncbi:DUF4396 domain-containing protein [Paraburkholderia caribensis]|uniref:DUF4396 domain-containing protein n=1 Tax=Paraburkholderia caribensis TaxID=75105 RepID=UPI002854702E|nr:hypothetical protein [Paraburkholderia caribensis]
MANTRHRNGTRLADWLAFVPPASIEMTYGTFLFGIVFQYFTIKPMRGLSVGAGVVAAVKADIASITAWQMGMYGLMAIIQFLWFEPAYGGDRESCEPGILVRHATRHARGIRNQLSRQLVVNPFGCKGKDVNPLLLGS